MTSPATPPPFAFYLDSLLCDQGTGYETRMKFSIGLPRGVSENGWLHVTRSEGETLLSQNLTRMWPDPMRRRLDNLVCKVYADDPRGFTHACLSDFNQGFQLVIGLRNLFQAEDLKGIHEAIDQPQTLPPRRWPPTPAVRRLDWPDSGWFAL
ncbi:MAG: hypothetical protein RJQ08_01040 [Salinisphaeraceae bacterium]